eukprot:UN12804
MNSALQLQSTFAFPKPLMSSISHTNTNKTQFSSVSSFQYSSLLQKINNIPPPPSTFEIGNRNIPITQNNYELFHRIEMEKADTIVNTQKLSQLHAAYNDKLNILKQKIIKLKRKSVILEQNNSKESIETILKQKQEQYCSYYRNQASRSRDEKQLKNLCKDNDNLKIVVESLNKQLRSVIQQILCQNQRPNCRGDNNMISYAMQK